jgi:carbon monoxide dehydrogenase subunit G
MPVFEERFQVAAPAETVWALLIDPVRLAPCLPGCQALEVVDPDTYRVTLSVKVGFLSTTQDMRMTVVEKDPPRRLVAVGRGEDRRIGSQVDVRSTLELTPGAAADTTLVRYRSEVKVLGRLGSVGDAVMKVKAAELAGEFAGRVRRAVEGTTA